MLALILAAAVAVIPAAPHPFGHGGFGKGSYGPHYTNAAGHIVKRPVQSDTPPSDATGECNDGFWTFSESRDGACSGHGGLRAWLGSKH